MNPSVEWKNGGYYNHDLAFHQGENDSLVIMLNDNINVSNIVSINHILHTNKIR